MKTSDLLNKTIPELNDLIDKAEITYEMLAEKIIKSIKNGEDEINSYITLNIEQALEKARSLDKSSHISQKSLLRGMPISVKDTFTTKGVRTTVASEMLKNFIPEYDATAYKRLKSEDILLLGKTNMDEFAHGFTNEYSVFGPVRNPWDTSLVPGGSSGGSAASVSARMAVLSLASENFGSIVQPAALCGVVGMKPTYGRSSRFGIIAMASSMECPGIIGKCVEDVAIGIENIIGKDPLDATSVKAPREDFYSNLSKQVRGKKIAIIKPIYEMLGDEIKKQVDYAVSVFKQIGAEVGFINWYDLKEDPYIYDILYRSEVASNLARYDGIRYGFRPEKDSIKKCDITSLHEYYLAARDKFGKHVKRQILTEPVTISDEDEVYEYVLRLRRKNRTFINEVFEKFDAVMTPATAFTTLEVGETKKAKWRRENRDLGKINGAMMCPTVLYGYPAISFPSNILERGIPFGMHLYSKQFNEQLILNLAYSYQEETGLKCLVPKISRNKYG
jgi:aspartyl-tRNA(Asn)/glutamyl-tRNA(Gln) amidotransferase subunit A